MVQFEHKIPAQGLGKEARFERLRQYVQQIVDGPNKIEGSRFTAQEANEGILAASIKEYLWFKRNAFVWDRTQMAYQLYIQIEDNETTLTLRNIHYVYDAAAERSTDDVSYRAEEWITDKEALKRGGKKLTRIAGKKFRVKTIDRKNEIFAGAEAACRP